VFCHFTEEITIVQEELIKCGVLPSKIQRIEGHVSSEDRNTRIKTFKEETPEEGNAVLIMQIVTGSLGLNIQEATRIYILSPSWNPSTELQAIGRAHRTGQTKKVYIKRLIYENPSESINSIDLALLNLQNRKAKLSSEILDDKRIETMLPNEMNNCEYLTLGNIFK